MLWLRWLWRDSSVGIATRYGMGGPGIESRWGGGRFSASVQTGPGAHPVSCTMSTGSFPGVKRPGRGVDHPLPSRAEVEGRVELYICSPSGPSWPVLGRTLPLPFYLLGWDAVYLGTNVWSTEILKGPYCLHHQGRWQRRCIPLKERADLQDTRHGIVYRATVILHHPIKWSTIVSPFYV